MGRTRGTTREGRISPGGSIGVAQRYRRGSMLGELAPPKPPPSTSCPRASRGRTRKTTVVRRGAIKQQLGWKWKNSRVASVSKGRCGSRARHKERRKRGQSSAGRVEGASLAESKYYSRGRSEWRQDQPDQGAVRQGAGTKAGERGGGERWGRRRRLLDQLSGCPQDTPPPLPPLLWAVARALPRPGCVL